VVYQVRYAKASQPAVIFLLLSVTGTWENDPMRAVAGLALVLMIVQEAELKTNGKDAET